MSETDFLKSRFFSGIELVESGKLKEAREVFLKVVEVLPDHLPSWENALYCSTQLDDVELVRQTFRRMPLAVRSIDTITMFAGAVEEWSDVTLVLQSLVIETKSEDDKLKSPDGALTSLKILIKEISSFKNGSTKGADHNQVDPSSGPKIDPEKFMATAEALAYLARSSEEPEYTRALIKLFLTLIDDDIFRDHTFQFATISLLHSAGMFAEITDRVVSSKLKLNEVESNSLEGILDALNKTKQFDTSCSFIDGIDKQEVNHKHILLFAQALEHCSRIPDAINLIARHCFRLSSTELVNERVRLLSEENRLIEAKEFYMAAKKHGIGGKILEKHLAKILLYSGDYENALRQAETILKLDPNDQDLRQVKSESLIALGRFDQGFMELYSATNDENLAQSFSPEILIAGDQGIGDQLMFLQMLKTCENQLSGLGFRFNYEINKKIRFVTKNRGNTISVSLTKLSTTGIPAFIVQNLGEDEFHRLFAPGINSDIPNVIDLDESEINGDTIAVCLGSSATAIGKQKTISWSKILEILKSSKYRFVCLEYSEASKIEAEKLNDERVVFPDCDLFNDVGEVAKIIQQCDHVIAGSNSFAHLAGFLNKPTSLAVTEGYGRLWYWRPPFLIDGRSSIYPKTKLYLK
ncbi:MAG: hypothetical protein CMQ84_09560 [Gammaproteobacteria bacterium]|nr:hypothetical protein [Gammaproteobacteria bacterium]OUX75612.1 MAG: hypothetical protein CBC19_10900 [Oceanospirillales bacterium TMED59]